MPSNPISYSSQKHRDALKSCGIKNCIQDKAAKNNPLMLRKLLLNSLITKACYVVERTSVSQAHISSMSRYCVTGGLPH